MRHGANDSCPVLLILLLTAGASVLSVAAEAARVNYIDNPGFETGRLHVDDGIESLHLRMMEPSHWWAQHAYPDRGAHYLWGCSAALNGDYGVSIDTRSVDSPSLRFEAWSSYAAASELAGLTVRLRVNTRLEAVSECTAIEFRIHAFNGDDAAAGICGAAHRVEESISDWTAREMRFHVPADTTCLLIQLGLVDRGIAWFDDVALMIDESGQGAVDTWTLHRDDPRCIPTRPTAGLVIGALTPREAALPAKPWNILMYDAADFLDAYSPAEHFGLAVYSNDRTNVLVFEDPYGGPASIYTATCSTYPVELTPICELGEPDVAKSTTLEDFLKYAGQWFPAEHTLLYLYGHGHACWGACYDDTNGVEGAVVRDWLSPLDLQAALQAVGGVDAVMFSAPCATSSIEAAYQVRDVTDLYVAAEEVSGYWYWRDAVEPLARTLASNPSIDAGAIGITLIAEIQSAIQSMINNRIPYVEHQPAIAATLTEHLPLLAQALDEFAVALMEALPEHGSAIIAARDESEEFLYGELVDLYDFADRCCSVPELHRPATAVMGAVNRAVIAQTINSADHPDGHGLSLYFPRIDSQAPPSFGAFSFERSGQRYCSYGLTLLDDTHWYEFLDAFFAEAGSP
jgi:hypothetical protein